MARLQSRIEKPLLPMSEIIETLLRHYFKVSRATINRIKNEQFSRGWIR